jgi:hypothetical protein
MQEESSDEERESRYQCKWPQDGKGCLPELRHKGEPVPAERRVKNAKNRSTFGRAVFLSLPEQVLHLGVERVPLAGRNLKEEQRGEGW